MTGADDAGALDAACCGVAALAERWGARVATRRRRRRDPFGLVPAIAAALEDFDVVVIIGGARGDQAGARADMIAALGLKVVFGGVAMHPGGSVWLARAHGKSVIGLPGAPLAAMIAARLVLAPLLAVTAGAAATSALVWRRETTRTGLARGGPVDVFLYARRANDGVRALSGDAATRADLDVLIRRRAGAAPSRCGSDVEALDF